MRWYSKHFGDNKERSRQNIRRIYAYALGPFKILEIHSRQHFKINGILFIPQLEILPVLVTQELRNRVEQFIRPNFRSLQYNPGLGQSQPRTHVLGADSFYV